jgi:hypothetical protein
MKLNKQEIVKQMMLPLALVRAFFLAITNVAWGLLSIFGLNALIAYLIASKGIELTTINTTFLAAENIILNNIIFFTIIGFVLEAYRGIKDLK